jgi:hypothetical protein
MGYDRTAPKRPVNLNLNADLIEQCRSGIANFSVASFAADDDAKRRIQGALDAVLKPF